ncbi:Polysaccharide pyruvyl transferase [Fibrobacter sp. UWB16]|uniref:polysaccharide pyruvyl transferase family protein n=1 Tax=Fibrobacter sp. UWB16 TaxID=1945874 RepID=UPI000BC5D971|nr:polysaccharide pyruvyl transferase family protein [Fibrobacter sp. UWB16]SOD11539.1 Polysaccharide pyruvyl transferase [Fibrobacter sp. UWB16]
MKKVVIVTLPLQSNYGGLLQNFALHNFIKKNGYTCQTIDFLMVPRISFFSFFKYSLKSLFLLFIPSKRRKFLRFSCKGFRSCWANDFACKWLKLTAKCFKYNESMLDESYAIIVGSDQVWRPKYNYRIEDMFLKFAEKKSIKRIAYAASFGVDEWEYTPRQTKICAGLAKKFHAISVREESGVMLCKEKLGVDAAWVLDPTLLLSKDDYLPICEEIPVCADKYLAVYVLDENKEISATYEKEAASRGLVVKKFHADSKSTLTVPEWLAMFRDASYVVTDSFHGTVFSIIFGKEFKCIYNKDRGSARFDSLLKLYESGKLDEMREFSLNWLKSALEK